MMSAQTYSKYVSKIVGTSICALGLIVIWGWFTHNLTITQIKPGYLPMRFNSAASMALCGTTLLLLDSKFSRIGIITSSLVIILSSLTLLEYLIKVDFGIDSMFLNLFKITTNDSTSRITQSTAIAYLLISISLCIIVADSSFSKLKSFVISLFGSIVVGFGSVQVMGYLSSIDAIMYWANYRRMAFHTSCGFIALGAFIIWYGWQKSKANSSWLPIPIFLCLTLISLLLSGAFRNQEQINFNNMLDAEAQHISDDSKSDLTYLYSALDRIGARWSAAHGTPKNLWESDTQTYLHDYPYLKGISYADTNATLQWITARTANKTGYGFKLTSEAHRAEAVNAAIKTHKSQATPILKLLTGEWGFLYITPLYSDDKYDGLQVAVFHVDDFFNNILKEEGYNGKKFYYTVLENNQVLFSTKPKNYVENYFGSANLNNNKVYWTIKVEPTSELLASCYSFTPILVIVIGSCVSFLVALCIYMSQKSRAVMGEEQRRLAHIVTIQRDIAHLHHDLDYAMNLIANSMKKITNADGCVIEMIEGDEIIYREAAGSAIKSIGTRIPIENSLSGLCIKNNKTLKCDNAELDDRVNKEGCRKIGLLSMVVVPLVRQRSVVGVLKVLSSKANAFNEKHIATLELMAGVLSAALDDAMANYSLRQSEEKFRAAMHNSSIGVALVAPDGKWLEVNRAVCDIVGYSSDELLNTDFQTITYPDDLESDMAQATALLAGKISGYQMEKRYIHKNGSLIWVLLTVSLVRKIDSSPDYFISQIQDITLRKTADVEREKLLNQLVSSNEELERFAYVASHDMQEPLRMISNFSMILDEEYADKFDADGKQYLKFMVDGAKRMQLLITDLLEYARIGNEGARLIEVDAMEEFNHVKENLGNLLKETNATVTSDPLPKFMGNGVQFMRLLQNLIGNGMKYQTTGAKPKVHISFEDAPKHYTFHIKDNGIGMSEEYLEQVFKPFKRLHSWQEFKGTGIGLAVCKKIVENHGGKIWITSQLGKGSTFHFTISKIME